MKTADDSSSPVLAQSVEHARGILQQREVAPDALQLAGAAARLAASLTDDASLAVGVLLYVAFGRRAPGDATARRGLPVAAVRVAIELERLGGFGEQLDWSRPGQLDAGQAETLRKMLLAVVSDPRLVVARLAIELTQLRAARTLPVAERLALARQTRAVFAPLANRLGIWRLKWELEDLAFRHLEPEAYSQLARGLDERRDARERYVEDFCEQVRTELDASGVSAEVFGRAKHLYSIHRKMQQKQLSLSQLFDLRAVRVICASIPDCYAALGAIHGRFAYLAGEFDDYIATPKANGYRSIHTAVLGSRDRPVEIQIRTAEMHAAAELGVAAHWRYKEGLATAADYARRIDELRALVRDAGERIDAPAAGDDDASAARGPGHATLRVARAAGLADSGDADFLARARRGLFDDRVYALTPKGEAIDLPRDSTPLDFAYHVHTSLGHRCRGAKINGRIAPLTRHLSNGDVVEIVVGRDESPSRDWLSPDHGFLASARSRAKVRAWFRAASKEREDGAGASVRLAPRTATAQVGADAARGDTMRAVSPRNVRAPRGQRGAVRGKRTHPIQIDGVGDLPLSLARCCQPVRPQPIVGYVTLGRGLTIHAANCGSLRRMQRAHPQRALSVRWHAGDSTSLPVRLRVVAYDRRGLVRDLSDAVAAEDLSIDSLQTTTDRREGTATTTLNVAIRDLNQLDALLRKLGRVANVLSARRAD